jgi:cytidyltransferase-like protein
MAHISTLKKLYSLKIEGGGKTIGLITGCFDVLHIGHIELLRFAKKHCDIVIVGVEQDETIRNKKGEGRPLNNFKTRMSILSELRCIDYIFPIPWVVRKDDKNIGALYEKLLIDLRPDFLMTVSSKDRASKSKKAYCKKHAVTFLSHRKSYAKSTTSLIKLLGF